MSVSATHAAGPPAGGPPPSGRRNYARSYWLFAAPAAVVVAAVMVFPWLFTLYMSVHDWKVSGATPFVGLANYAKMLSDDRFLWAIIRTLIFTAGAVIAPVILGVWAAVTFAGNFLGRGIARTVFVLPMMATPVAISLVWTMMFHPQLGVLNYLLSLVGLPPFGWVYDTTTVIPTLVMVETWQWTPLVMLIVLGGIASLPQDPYEAAVLDGATPWQRFWHITLPLAWPFVVVAAAIRMIDALKTFDTIYVITLGGPGTASETLNILLYQTAFAYYDLGYGSAMVVVFFVIILVITLLMLGYRQKGIVT
ncbi:carbohydrate ABC transporter permease [Rhodopila sp.]|uniref:carbohydrate ABC transporter permease n=1 Tax=Rhodopila sp. TaxID=2480087 RepID=UPI002B7DD7B4|nr:sugar ABC transporter permease [Rhodopila sp.]HVZ10334.1 sugar ABC transporter permease [Rhodopila sp.]